MVDLANCCVLRHQHPVTAPEVRGVTTQHEHSHRRLRHQQREQNASHGRTRLFDVEHDAALVTQVRLHRLPHGLDAVAQPTCQLAEILPLNVPEGAEAPVGRDGVGGCVGDDPVRLHPQHTVDTKADHQRLFLRFDVNV